MRALSLLATTSRLMLMSVIGCLENAERALLLTLLPHLDAVFVPQPGARQDHRGDARLVDAVFTRTHENGWTSAAHPAIPFR